MAYPHFDLDRITLDIEQLTELSHRKQALWNDATHPQRKQELLDELERISNELAVLEARRNELP